MSKSIFIAIPKKPGAVECENHRTISLMSHVTKIVLRILLLRARSKITPEIGREQFGFVQDAGTRNAIFVLRAITERAIEMQKDVYMCFIDYSKAFDKVRHQNLFEDMAKLDLHGKDIRLLKNLYWNQSACVKIDGDLSKYTKIKRGVRQGCVMSPDLFNYYSELILRELHSGKSLRVGGQNITNLWYADDTVFLAESEEKKKKLLDVVVRESVKKGMSINCKKTECMVVSKRNDILKCKVKVKDETIKQVAAFNYLGSTITEDARCEKEIRRRIALAKSAFSKLDKLLRNPTLSLNTRMRILECYVYPVLMYGSESWTISSSMKKRLESCELWFLRRMMRIPWVDRVRNKDVLRRAGTHRKLIKDIRVRQLRFLGHVIRKEGLEDLALTGKIDGKRSRGRKRISWLAGLNEWVAERSQQGRDVDLINKARSRELWKLMIADVLRYGT